MLQSIRIPSMGRLGPSSFLRIGVLLFWVLIIPITIRSYLSSNRDSRLLSSWSSGSGSQTYSAPSDPDACPPLAELENVLVVVKTGSTESREKIPVHFKTTLRCIPNFLVISDLEEELGGNHVIDVLDNSISPEMLKSEPEFNMYYQRLRDEGRDAITEEELDRWRHAENTVFGTTDNLAWKLDKWKFVPMLEKAYHHKPDAKWYVFMEADTYVIWDNMLAWLANFNPVKKHYLGEQMQIGDVVFAYGGTGYVLSNPAIRKAVKYHKANAKAIEEFTKAEWAGDMILGWVLHEAGIDMHWSWPNLQGQLPTDVDYFAVGWDKRQWCYAAVTYHHMKPNDISAFNKFERGWNGPKPMLHRDVFLHYVLPQVVNTGGTLDDWDNLSDFAYPPPGHQAPVESFEACRAICEMHGACLQFTFVPGLCKIGATVKFGRKSAPSSSDDDGNTVATEHMRSGWMLDRIERYLEFVPRCEEGEWVLPEGS